MTKEEFEKEANKWADNIVWALVDMKREANYDERDFLVQEYKDLQERFTKEVQVKIDNRLKRHCNTIHSLVDELERRQNVEKELENRGWIKVFKEYDSDKAVFAQINANERQLEWLGNHQVHYSKFACMQ